MATEQNPKKTSLSDMEVPEERKGLSPEERAYQPQVLERHIPRYTFPLLLVFLLLAFAGGGAYYYHVNILPEKLYQQADRLFKDKEYQPALVLYRKVLKIRPERKDTLLQIGRSLEHLGNAEEALHAYAQHLRNQPNDRRALVRAAKLYRDSGQIGKAAASLKKLVALQPDNRARLFELATLQLALSEDKQAKAALLRVVKKEDENAELLLKSAKALLELKEYRDALRAYEKAAALLSGDMRGEHGARSVRAMLGLPQTAETTLTPGKSVGLFSIGSDYLLLTEQLPPLTRKETLHRGNKTYTLYRHESDKQHYLIFYVDAEGKIVQIRSNSPRYLTAQGVGLTNFFLPKHANAFKTAEPGQDLFTMVGGGLTFYRESSSDFSEFSVYRGEEIRTTPLRETASSSSHSV